MNYKLIIDSTGDEEIIARVHAPSALTAAIENLVNSYTGNDSIVVRSGEDVIKLGFSDVECITVIDRKVYAIDKNGDRRRVGTSLSELEAILPSYFIRINKSAIANENRIQMFNTVYSGAVDAVFKCGYKEYVSRRCFREIKRRLGVK